MRLGARLGLALVLVASTAVVLAWQPAGRTTPDGGAYLDGARGLASGRGFTTALVSIGAETRRPIAAFPPGFSLLLVPGISLGLGARESAGVVLGLACVAYVLATYVLVGLAAGRAWWPAALLASAVLMLHPAVLDGADNVLSDLPMAAVATASAALAIRICNVAQLTRGRLLALGVLLAALVLLRWSGVYVVIGILAGTWLALAGRVAVARRSRRLALVAALPVTALALCWVRNLAWAGTLTGRRRLGVYDPLVVWSEACEGVARGFARHGPFGEWLGWALLLGALVGGPLVVLAHLRGRAQQLGPLVLLLTATAVYVLCMLATASVQHFDPLDRARFWLPVWPLLLAAVAGGIVRLGSVRPAQIATGALVGLLLLATGVGFAGVFRRGLPDAGVGRGYSRPDVALLAATLVRVGRSARCSFVSNNPPAILANQRLDRIHRLPVVENEILPLFEAGRPVCIAYFTRSAAPSVRARSADRAVLRALLEADRIRPLYRNAAGQLWVSRVPGRSPRGPTPGA